MGDDGSLTDAAAKEDGRPLLIVVHDYSGHPGQVSLSRTLARRGHTVVHQYCPSYTTGKGAVERQPDDPDGFAVERVSLDESFARYTVVRRIRQEVRYGVAATRAITAHHPEVALLSNLPLLSLVITAARLRRIGIPVVFWQQDVYSAAIHSAAVRRLGRVGVLVGLVAGRLERWVARRSAAVVPIDESFTEVLRRWGLPDDRIHVVPNWAPIAELPVRPKDNDWSQRHRLAGQTVVLYAGTLGLKHDPRALSHAAEVCRGEATVVVISEGLGRTLLEQVRAADGLDNLRLLDFQPYEDLPDILATADVLVALLEPEAGQYSVPSKVLTYLCAARPIVAVVPEQNSVARIIDKSGAGRVVAPGDTDGFVGALNEILTDAALRDSMGRNARNYAESTFDTERVGDRFERILRAAAG
jgi:glycosyltransferase involved in cell wall biosynthesis